MVLVVTRNFPTVHVYFRGLLFRSCIAEKASEVMSRRAKCTRSAEGPVCRVSSISSHPYLDSMLGLYEHAMLKRVLWVNCHGGKADGGAPRHRSTGFLLTESRNLPNATSQA